MNPVKQLRLAYNLTQDELAAKLGITRQTITDLETGLYIQPGPSFLAVLPKEQRPAFMEEYAKWLHKTRLENASHINLSAADTSSFKAWCESIGGSVKGACRVFCIQTSIVSQYISDAKRWSMIERILVESGIPQDYVTLLQGLPRK